MQQRGKTVVVKKYSNRRLYDTADSRYITLDELAQKIKRGTDVRVIDAGSEEDLTQATLTQIILESGRAARLLPVQLLSQLIRMEDDELAEFFNRYMSWAMEMYQHAKSGAQALAPYNPFATLPFVASNALARFFTGGQPGWADGPNAGPPPPSAKPSPSPQAASSEAPDPSPPPVSTAGPQGAHVHATPPPSYASSAAEAPPPSHSNGTSDEVAALRRELEELKDAIRTKLR